MTLVADIKSRIEDQVIALRGRVQEAADLAELVRQGALPNQSPAAFVLPLGFDGQPADVAAGLYRQGRIDVVGVVLFVEAVGDPKARKAIAKIDALTESIVRAVAGWRPETAIGVFEARRGRLVQVSAGGVLYQVDFALFDQLRIERP